MATKNPTIVLGATWADGVDSLQEMIDAIEKLVIGDFDRDNMDRTDSSIITISSSSPAGPGTGEFWLDTSGTPYNLKFFNGSVWVSVGFSISATAPTSPALGQLWRDTTLGLLRQYATVDDLTGWHPVDGSYQLWRNDEGATVEANRVVALNTGVIASDTPRKFVYTSILGDQTVVGVTLESTDDGEDAVIAHVGGGASVEVLCSGATRSVSRNDFLVTSGTDGEARTMGPRKTNAYVALDERWVGEPTGAFAVALEGASGNTTVRCQMLGHVGAGMDVWFEREAVGTGDNATTTGVATGTWVEADVTTNLKDADHTPILGAYLECEVEVSSGSANDERTELRVDLSLDQTAVHRELQVKGSGGALGAIGSLFDVFMPTVDEATGSATGRGEKLSHRIDQIDGNATGVADSNLRIRGYRV